MYQDYQELHQKFKPNCCNKQLCRFFEVGHYVNFNYQDYFLKSLKNYLSEVVVFPKEDIKKLFISKHSQFISVQTPVMPFDESIEI
jgi:hypothetical protein